MFSRRLSGLIALRNFCSQSRSVAEDVELYPENFAFVGAFEVSVCAIVDVVREKTSRKEDRTRKVGMFKYEPPGTGYARQPERHAPTHFPQQASSSSL